MLVRCSLIALLLTDGFLLLVAGWYANLSRPLTGQWLLEDIPQHALAIQVAVHTGSDSVRGC